jgi:two-component system cell cycle response regulator
LSPDHIVDPEVVLRETRQRFIAGFQAQCAEITALTRASTDSSEGDAAIRLLHRMAGLAGTVGLARVSAEAQRLEHDFAASAPPPAIDAGIGRLRRAFTDDIGEAVTATGAVAPTPGALLTVMLVEDDPDQRAVVAAHLRGAGHTVVEVESGDRALAAARESSPTVILLDLDLPGLDGHAVCRLLKDDPALSGIPVMFLSAEQDLNDRLAALALGADDFLMKPIDPRELLMRLQRLRQRLASSEPGAANVLATYDEFRTVALTTLEREPAAVALVRAPHDGRDVVMRVLQQETRRRDVVADYDRHHIAVLLPAAGVISARDRMVGVIDVVRRDGVTGVVAGVAASAAASERTLDSLLEEAEEALAAARYRGVAVGLRSEESAVGAGASQEGPLVLVGDDDPDVVRIVDAHLGAGGYRRVLAFDGAKTLEQLQRQPPALLVLDLMMPRMTGFEVLSRIREVTEAPPKIIVLSGRGREDDVTRAFDLGADDYMVKPFNPQELMARIARLLR